MWMQWYMKHTDYLFRCILTGLQREEHMRGGKWFKRQVTALLPPPPLLTCSLIFIHSSICSFRHMSPYLSSLLPHFFSSHLLPPFFSLSFSSPVSSIFSSLIVQKHLFCPTCLCSLLHSRGRLFCLHLLLTPLLLLPSVLHLLQLDTQVSQNMHTHTHSCIICKPSDLL